MHASALVALALVSAAAPTLSAHLEDLYGRYDGDGAVFTKNTYARGVTRGPVDQGIYSRDIGGGGGGAPEWAKTGLTRAQERDVKAKTFPPVLANAQHNAAEKGVNAVKAVIPIFDGAQHNAVEKDVKGVPVFASA